MKRRVLIWGYKVGSHSHAYINLGFYRAFEYLGYETFWFNDNDDVSDFDFKDCIFLCEGQSCKNIPKRKDCLYICHNCEPMDGIVRRINIQYLTREWSDSEEIAPGIKLEGDCVLFPWGANMLPNEFNEELLTSKRDKNIYFLGTMSKTGGNGTYDRISMFADVASHNGYKMIVGGGYTGNIEDGNISYLDGWISEEDQAKYLSSGVMSPAIQSDFQLKNGMIPCRLFKSISYGMIGITNNDFAHSYFQEQTIYSTDMEELFYLAEKELNNLEKKKFLFNFVRENHTYINNINAILKVLL